jgi:hypothetical protein
MRITYDKSELVTINMEQAETLPFLDIFQCVEGMWPVKYLWLPLHFEILKSEDLQSLIDSLLGHMAGWRGKLLSLEAKKGY